MGGFPSLTLTGELSDRWLALLEENDIHANIEAEETTDAETRPSGGLQERLYRLTQEEAEVKVLCVAYDDLPDKIGLFFFATDASSRRLSTRVRNILIESGAVVGPPTKV